jgi:hypothetical protein
MRQLRADGEEHRLETAHHLEQVGDLRVELQVDAQG